MTKKKHHFVPESYLNFFCDEAGYVHFIRKDAPHVVHRQRPNNFAFHKYYYAQPLPRGDTDTDTLEDFFSKLETQWPNIVQKIAARENVNSKLEQIFEFLALQRVRVPAMRDAIEMMDAINTKTELVRLHVSGLLPPPSKEYPDLIHQLSVAIDPHRSITAMPRLIENLTPIMHRIGLIAIHNNTDIPFLTSDNPVVYFDPTVPSDELMPYAVDAINGSIVLMMPLTPNIMLFGHSSDKARFSALGLGHKENNDEADITLMNEQICRFAYQAVFANHANFASMVQQFADKSPILRASSKASDPASMQMHDLEFGARIKKPKWDR